MKKIVVIGSSTGGPRALAELFSQLPANFPAPVIVAQHLTSQLTTSLAARLDRVSPLPVTEVRDNEQIMPGHAYVIPGDFHFFFTPGPRIHLLAAKKLPKPSIDMGLVSCAEHFGPRTIGVILSGMGDDGLVGAKAVKQLGGKILIQDEPTSVIFGMGARVKEAGLADEVLPLEKIAKRLVELV